MTLNDSLNLERIQKQAFRLILGDKYTSYYEACKFLQTETLANRRIKICETFAKKELKRKNSFFEPFVPKFTGRHTAKKKVKEYTCLTDRFFKSSIPFLSRLLNSEKLTSRHWMFDNES